MDELIKILKNINPDIDYKTEEKLVEDKIYNSLNIVMLICALSEKFNIKITPEYMINDNFNSAQRIWKMIMEIKGENETKQ